ncbi:MAG: ribosome silencing factor, partial [Chitinophagales bacterium]
VRKRATAAKPTFTPTTEVILSAIKEKKGDNICTIDLRNINDAVCDFFVVCDASSTTQVRAIAMNVEGQVLKERNEKPWHIEGVENQEWILLDFVDVVVHIFLKPLRGFYQLEELWSDGVLVEHNE